jgi:hypothetical protein
MLPGAADNKGSARTRMSSGNVRRIRPFEQHLKSKRFVCSPAPSSLAAPSLGPRSALLEAGRTKVFRGSAPCSIPPRRVSGDTARANALKQRGAEPASETAREADDCCNATGRNSVSGSGSKSGAHNCQLQRIGVWSARKDGRADDGIGLLTPMRDARGPLRWLP